ncbi:MAG: bile acid:sodium symporter, partial [Thermoplasmatales archaeon]
MGSDKILKKLSVKDLLFPFFVTISIALGLVLGSSFRSGSSVVATYGIPIGLFFMIYPAMAKVRLDEMGKSIKNVRTVGLTALLNYAITPFIVAGIAYFFIYMVYLHFSIITSGVASQLLVGIILLGIAPCIGMVMVWTDMSHGNLPLGVSLVAWNSIIQIITTPFLIYLLTRTSVTVSPYLIIESVLLYLGLPMLAGIIPGGFSRKRNIITAC